MFKDATLRFSQGSKIAFKGLKHLLEPRIFLILCLTVAVNLGILSAMTYGIYYVVFQYLTPKFLAWVPNLVENVSLFKWLTLIFQSLFSLSLANYLILNLSPLLLFPIYAMTAGTMARKLSLQPLRQPVSKNKISLLTCALIRELKKILYIILLLFFLVCSFFIPFVHYFSPFLAFLVSSLITTLQYLDYYSDHLNQPLEHTFRIMRSNPWIVLGFGMTLTFFSNVLPILSCVTILLTLVSSAYLYRAMAVHPKPTPLEELT